MKSCREILRSYGFATWAFLAFIFTLVLVMNVFAIPAHDELALAFAGQNTPTVGECSRVASLMDIVRQQWCDLHTANGRVLIHGLVAIFASFKLYYLFDVLNAFMWLLLVFLVMREADVDQGVFGNVVVCHGLAFLFLWWPETAFMNAAFAVNYLWTAVFTLVMLRLWRGGFSWGILPIYFVFGWSQETFVLPFIAAAMVDIVVGGVVGKRFDIKRILAVILMLIGVSLLIFCPGAMRRAGESVSTPVEMLATIARAMFGVLLAVWPAVLLVSVAILGWVSRKDFKGFVLDNMMLLCYIFASIGLFVLGCSNGIYRLLMPSLVVSLMLVLKERTRLTFLVAPSVIISLLVLGFMSAAAGVQIDMGLANFEYLRRYKGDAQGVTYRRIVRPSVFANACSRGLFKGWHNSLWRLEFDKPMAPICLNKYLYENLYQKSSRFFAEAECVGDGWFVTDKARGIAVKIGEIAHESPSTFFSSTRCISFVDKLPGRIKFMFPSESEDIDIPGHRAFIKTCDGKSVTIVQKKD